MELREAIAKANQILDEERVSPTVFYKLNEKEISHPLAQAIGLLNEPQLLHGIRSQRPRQVQENPRRWSFTSTNYNLVSALLSQVPQDSKPAFLRAILVRLNLVPGCAYVGFAREPHWDWFVSELPLVAEFYVRSGLTGQFFSALGEATALPGHAVLLRHLEDMIALDFTVFTDAEYQHVSQCVQNFRELANQKLNSSGNTSIQWPGIKPVDARSLLAEIVSAAEGIKEECRKARYYYLKGSLLEGLNLEINQDKDAVQSYMQTLGFSPALAQSLDEAERLRQDEASPFSLKASMGHIRSFLENLHSEALPNLHMRFGGILPQGWGGGLAYLRNNQVLSAAEEKFAAGIFTFISDQAVHPLYSGAGVRTAGPERGHRVCAAVSAEAGEARSEGALKPPFNRLWPPVLSRAF